MHRGAVRSLLRHSLMHMCGCADRSANGLSSRPRRLTGTPCPVCRWEPKISLRAPQYPNYPQYPSVPLSTQGYFIRVQPSEIGFDEALHPLKSLEVRARVRSRAPARAQLR